MEREVRDNPERQRYELVVDERNGDTVTVPHIETDPQHRGQGMADSLMVGVLADLRSRGRRIVPVCPYAAAYLDAHPDQQDLLA
jgi:predicted GNAT family acetyltransferase